MAERKNGLAVLSLAVGVGLGVAGTTAANERRAMAAERREQAAVELAEYALLTLGLARSSCRKGTVVTVAGVGR